MSDVAVSVIAEDIGASLRRLVEQAKDRVTLVAPFIKRGALERLLAGLGPAVSLSVITRWRLDELCAGVSDLGVFDLLRERAGARLLLHPRLHAKVLLVDDTLAAVGSANVTDAALGFAGQPNAEVVVSLRPVPNRLFLFLAQMEAECVPATEELRLRFEEAMKAAPPPASYPEVPLPSPAPRGPPPPFPQFRSPERLYRGYLSLAEFSDPETRAAILQDLHVLSLPDGLDEATFRTRVGTALLAVDLIVAFDGFVRQPRFFGEMAEWLAPMPQCAGLDAEQRKHYLQALIRWLLYFLPGRYSLSQPGYSELFGRTEGGEAT
jgi:hypothetical protein